MKSTDLNTFLKKVMEMRVLTMGGASAGIFGVSRADNDVLNNLKKNAAAFAEEYSKQSPDAATLQKYSQEVEGQLRILELTNTVSQDTADELIDKLHALGAKTSA